MLDKSDRQKPSKMHISQKRGQWPSAICQNQIRTRSLSGKLAVDGWEGLQSIVSHQDLMRKGSVRFVDGVLFRFRQPLGENVRIGEAGLRLGGDEVHGHTRQIVRFLKMLGHHLEEVEDEAARMHREQHTAAVSKRLHGAFEHGAHIGPRAHVRHN